MIKILHKNKYFFLFFKNSLKNDLFYKSMICLHKVMFLNMLKFLCGPLVWLFVSYKVHAYPFLIIQNLQIVHLF